MNETLSENPDDNGDPKPESSGSFKMVDKKQKKDRSSTKTPEEMVKTLRSSLEEVESENRQLNEMNSAYSTQLEEQLAYRTELNGVQEELEQVRHQRDKAIYRAGELTIESGKVSESYDRVAESKVVIEQMRRMIQTSLTQQSTSASVRGVSKKLDRRSGFRKLGSLLGFFKTDKAVISTCDDDYMLALTEDNTSVSSEDVLELEQAKFGEQPSMVFFTNNLNCSSVQLYNRRLLTVGLILDPPKNKKEN
jgi:predicted RNase H-like nuclease (RuvC/YqgF family)